MIKILLPIIIFILFIFLLHLWASGRFYSNKTDEQIVVNSNKTQPTNKDELSVFSYNMAYARGSKDDKGDLRDKSIIQNNLQNLVTLIEQKNPDIVALQEIDFDSKRTHFINQFEFLMDRLDYRYGAYVVTWRKAYVPYPIGFKFNQHYGKMVSGQAILSKYPITENKRIPLPQPDENFKIYNSYYLTRCFQICKINIGDRNIDFFNIHLEAFREKNRMAQVEMLVNEINNLENRDNIMAVGDFNSLPPNAKVKKGFWDEPETDFTTDKTIEIMSKIDSIQEIIKEEEYMQNEEKYLTFLSEKPSRRLDYIFYGTNGFEIIEGRIVTEAQTLSDHLPVWAKFKLK